MHLHCPSVQQSGRYVAVLSPAATIRLACRAINFLRGTPFIGARLTGDEAVPVVVNAKGRKPNEVGPNEVYIGRSTRNGWRKSRWGIPLWFVVTPARNSEPMWSRCIAGGCCYSPTCWQRCPSFAARIWFAGARRRHVT